MGNSAEKQLLFLVEKKTRSCKFTVVLTFMCTGCFVSTFSVIILSLDVAKMTLASTKSKSTTSYMIFLQKVVPLYVLQL